MVSYSRSTFDNYFVHSTKFSSFNHVDTYKSPFSFLCLTSFWCNVFMSSMDGLVVLTIQRVCSPLWEILIPASRPYARCHCISDSIRHLIFTKWKGLHSFTDALLNFPDYYSYSYWDFCFLFVNYLFITFSQNTGSWRCESDCLPLT